MLGRWKYGGDANVGAALAQLFAVRTADGGACYDLVVPVPLHPTKLRRRGFNQAGILARALVRRRRQTGRLCAGVLRRRRAAGVQAGLGRDARAGNVSEAFAATSRIDDSRVLLVDDVLTSGATASACARALIAAGAIGVDVAVLARTAKRSGD